MKKSLLIIGAIGLITISGNLSAQTKQSKEVRKEVNIEDENGEKTLTIKTIIDGQETVEVYKGAEAEAKLTEFADEKSGSTKTIVIGDDGKQQLKVEKKVVIREEIEEEK